MGAGEMCWLKAGFASPVPDKCRVSGTKGTPGEGTGLVARAGPILFGAAMKESPKIVGNYLKPDGNICEISRASEWRVAFDTDAAPKFRVPNPVVPANCEDCPGPFTSTTVPWELEWAGMVVNNWETAHCTADGQGSNQCVGGIPLEPQLSN